LISAKARICCVHDWRGHDGRNSRNFPFDNSYARLPDRFFARLAPTPVALPRLIKLNEKLARHLGLDPEKARCAGRRGDAGGQCRAGSRRAARDGLCRAISSAVSCRSWATVAPFFWAK
jgi:hypothetical protein